MSATAFERGASKLAEDLDVFSELAMQHGWPSTAQKARQTAHSIRYNFELDRRLGRLGELSPKRAATTDNPLGKVEARP